MKKIHFKILVILAILLSIGSYYYPKNDMLGARTSSFWKSTGDYIETTKSEGFDILISGANKYLNFNTLSGETGYGFRDNGGTMEVKSSGGAWAGVGGGGSGDMTKAVYDPAAINEQLVGLAATQTLTNKTLTTPSITNPTGLDSNDVGLGNVENTALTTWAGSSNLTTLGTIGSGLWNGTAIGDTYISSAATWNAKQDALTFGIANTNSVIINSTTVANGEYSKFTASGLESKSFAEVKTDLSLNNVENTALSTWAGSASLTTLGTISSGVWNGTAILDAYISDSLTVDWTGLQNYPTGCTNQFVRTIGDTLTCATVDFSADTNATGGRSVTINGDAIDSDEETYIYKSKIAFLDPVDTDDYFFDEIAHAATFTSIYCKTLVGTVNLDITIAGTDINGTDITCTTAGVLDSSLGGDTAAAVGEEVKLEITSVASVPTYVMIQLNGTYND